MKDNNKFLQKLLSCDRAVGYEPLKNEPSLSFLQLSPHTILPQSALLNPLALGNKLAAQFAGSSVCIYIPGTAFDRHGTRHGRGNGWYDRFLAAVPPEWLRIGICFESNFSPLPLRREAWDQPVDWVCVRASDGVEYYETSARQKI